MNDTCQLCSNESNIPCVLLIFANCITHNLNKCRTCNYVVYNFDVCRTCLRKRLDEVVCKIMPGLRTCDLMETLCYHSTPQNCFSYLSDSEKNKIACDRPQIKNLIGLPDVLSDIVLSYYWIFEQ
jgi:hypothetical protein